MAGVSQRVSWMWSFVLCWLSHTCVPLQIGSHIKRRVQELGHGCAALVTKAGALQCSPSDAYTKKELIESARKVSEKVNAPERGMVLWSGGRGAGLSHMPLEPPHWVLPWLCWVSQPQTPCPAGRVEDESTSPGTVTAAGAVVGGCDIQVLPADVLMVACQGRLIDTLVAAQGSPDQLLQWWA